MPQIPMIRLPLSNIETMTLEHMWNYENLIEQVLEFLDELAEITSAKPESSDIDRSSIHRSPNFRQHGIAR